MIFNVLIANKTYQSLFTNTFLLNLYLQNNVAILYQGKLGTLERNA